MPGPLEVLAQAYSLRGSRLMPTLSGILAQVSSLQGPRFMPGQQQSLALTYSLSSCSPLPSPMEFAVSGLLWPRLLAQSCLCKCLWSGSAPIPMELVISGLLWFRSLTQYRSHEARCLRPALA